ncbi:MAG: TonB-dependent receptor [Balneolaceae bacterium]|nr:MAG: TonB-dependent receptor [Balneolaceae bacterium]
MKRILEILLWLPALLLLTCTQITMSQPITQSIKGHVYEVGSQYPLIGATVVVLGTEPLIGAAADLDGNYVLHGVPVGRHSLQFSYIGYDPVVIHEIPVTSGKQVVIDAGLRESVSEMGGITVVAGNRKDIPMNSMATNSARSFTVEETRRYAGGLDDPARLVAAYAGVTVGNVQDNAIIIRGNTPKGVSWRLEGVEIPTPHHFSGANVAGGGIVTLFSSQMLANSDFFTSAFPAEYGNALAGVFDMNLRNGNFDRHEHTVQVGTLGLDVASEGPIASGSNASYLFNYRYSTLGLLTDLNMIPTDQLFKYQDLSFKVNIPTRNAGVFSFWGIGGIDKSTEPGELDPTKWTIDWDRVGYEWDVLMGATGITHSRIIGRQSFIRSTVAFTGIDNSMETYRLDDDLIPRPDLLATDRSGKLIIGTSLSHRFSPRYSVQTGIKYNLLMYNINMNSTISGPDTYRNIVNESGNSYSTEFYTQSRYDINSRFALNGGINAQYFALTDSWSADPRFGVTWSPNSDHTLSLGYGRHSQAEDMKIYLVRLEENGNVRYPNKDLGLSKAHHLVLGYDLRLSSNHRVKIETYFQHLYNAPGIADSSYSLINYKQEWAFDKELRNNSIGRNVGVDVTFERFLNNNYYYLLTGSLFDSRYKADDGIWRNTRFNKRYVVNALIGREFTFQQSRKVLGVNARVNFVGGERVSPIWLEESIRQEKEVFDETSAFSNQLPSITYVDLSVTYRINYRSYSTVLALQIKNLLGAPIYEGYNYNYTTGTVQLDTNVAIIPGLSYKVEF